VAGWQAGPQRLGGRFNCPRVSFSFGGAGVVRRDWFVTGTIVVIAAAIAVVYLSGVGRCESSPSTGTSTCYSTTPWSLPIVLLVMAIGAAIIVFSIVPVQWVRAMRAAVREDGPVKEPLRVGERGTNDHDLPPMRRVPKTRRATRVFGADKFEGGEANLENMARVERDEPPKTTREERRLRDWAERLAEREATLQATEERLRLEQEESDSRTLAPTKRSSSGAERGEIGATLEAAMSGILARLETIERRLTSQETVAAGRENLAPELKDERLASTERLEAIAKRLADDLDLDGRDLLAGRDGLLELDRDLRSREEVLWAELDQFIGGGLLSSEELRADDVKRVEPFPTEIKDLERKGAEPVPLMQIAAEPELRPPLTPSPTGKDTSREDSGQATEGILTNLITKGVAVEHISNVLQAAKKAVRSARDVTEVRGILERARASFDAGQYEEAMRQSDRILTLLRPTSADVRRGRVGPAEL